MTVRGLGRGSRQARNLWRRLFDYALTAAILGLLIVLAVRLDRTETRQVTGKVVVADGDSLDLGGERIRLLGIDAPEFDQICRASGADYPCGMRAREALIRAIAGRPAECAGWRRDRYDRLLASCTAGGADLNRLQVEAGWAVAYGDYEAEENLARRNRAGLWAGMFERPGDWRAQHGGMVEDQHGGLNRLFDILRQILPII